MSEYTYRRHRSELSHGIFTSAYNAIKRHERYERSRSQDIIGKRARTTNPYGNYKNPYYDPNKRHDYYEAHKDHVTRAYGTGGSSTGSGKSGSGKGRSGSGKGRSGSGKGRGGKSSGSKSNLAKTIASLREQSALETEAQREASKRKIEDIRTQLTDKIKALRGDTYEQKSSEKNQAEIRGITQGLKAKIENMRNKNSDEVKQESERLKKWIANERDSLERRIAALYKQAGMTYTPRTQADKENASKARDKEVKSRADSIYKSKSKK